MHVGFINPRGREELYGFVTKDGKHYIGLDSNSGGYPYETDRWQDMHTWTSKEKALDYEKMFKKKGWVMVGVVGLMLNFLKEGNND